MIRIVPEPPDAAPQIDALLDHAFGRDRRTKTAQRLRDGRLPVPGLAFVALDDGAIVGTIRLWHVRIGERIDALLLGPVAVARTHQGKRIGAGLVRRGLTAARAQRHGAVILVGDEPYYRRFGFSAEPTRKLALPGPVDRRRFLALELRPGALGGAAGHVRGTGAMDPARRRFAA